MKPLLCQLGLHNWTWYIWGGKVGVRYGLRCACGRWYKHSKIIRRDETDVEKADRRYSTSPPGRRRPTIPKRDNPHQFKRRHNA